MPGTLVSRRSSTRIPLSTARPAAFASAVRGVAPIPTTTRSASIRVPSAVSTASTAPPLPWIRRPAGPGPAARRARRGRRRRSPRPPARAPARASTEVSRTTVTSGPSWRIDAATSAPIQPPPTTTTRFAVPAASRSASESSIVRRYRIPSRSSPGTREPPRLGARRDQQPVEPDAPTVGQHDLPARRIDGLDRRRRLELHALLAVPRLGVDVDLVELFVAAQVFLGQRRTDVRPMRLAPEQDDAAVEAVLAQRLGGLRAREAGADDEDGPGVGHGGHC